MGASFYWRPLESGWTHLDMGGFRSSVWAALAELFPRGDGGVMIRKADIATLQGLAKASGYEGVDNIIEVLEKCDAICVKAEF